MSSQPNDVVYTALGRSTGVPCGGSSVGSPVPFPGPRLQLRWRWCRSLGRPADIGLGYLQSVNEPGCSQQPYPRSGSCVPACHGNPPLDAVCCSAPFCTSDGLIASAGPSPMGMNLDVAGVDHQPLKVRIVDNRIQQLFPDAPIPPAAKAPMGVLPITVIRWQVPPRSPSTQNPKHRVQKQSVVLGRSTLFASGPRQKGPQSFPNLVRNIVTPMRCCHAPTSHTHTLPSNLPSSCYQVAILTTLPRLVGQPERRAATALPHRPTVKCICVPSVSVSVTLGYNVGTRLIGAPRFDTRTGWPLFSLSSCSPPLIHLCYHSKLGSPFSYGSCISDRPRAPFQPYPAPDRLR